MQILIDPDTQRPENILTVDDFPSSKEHSFPSILCAESHTLLENSWKSFSVAMSHDSLTIAKAKRLTGKGKSTSKYLLHHVSLWERYSYPK